MRCPVCIKNKQKSEVIDLGCTATAMNCTSYYDKNGDYHLHDTNRYKSSFECTNGHRFERKFYMKCATCGYKHKENKTTIISGGE
jgi:hypothetical protein